MCTINIETVANYAMHQKLLSLMICQCRQKRMMLFQWQIRPISICLVGGCKVEIEENKIVQLAMKSHAIPYRLCISFVCNAISTHKLEIGFHFDCNANGLMRKRHHQTFKMTRATLLIRKLSNSSTLQPREHITWSNVFTYVWVKCSHYVSQLILVYLSIQCDSLHKSCE